MARKIASLHDTHAFSQLYERSQLIIFRYIYGLVGGPIQEVEDITAETFLKAWKYRQRFSGDEDAAVSWLITISRNLVIDRYRRRNINTEYNLEDETADIVIGHVQGIPFELQIEERQQFLDLWKMIQKLPIAQRELIILRYILDWRVNRIAAHLGVPENTVSVQLRRIVGRLRQRNP